MLKRLTLPGSIALLSSLAWVVPARADAPRPIDRASDTLGPDGRPITADDIKELDEMQKTVERYGEAEKDYRGTVSHIVKQEIEKKRHDLKDKYESQIKAAEVLEKARRLDAIAAFEKFLEKYPNDKRWTPDVIFRLAELYFEQTSDAALDAAPGQAPTNPDFTKTINLYTRLIQEFPDYRLIDGAYYLLGFCLDKMGKELEARQAFLALVCTNKYKPLDPPAAVQASKGHSANEVIGDSYKECKPIKDDSRFLPEAWTRVGEYHFDYNELELAINAYARVLNFKDSPYYDKALYKLAWSYYRIDKYPEAIKRFDELVVFSDTQKAASGKEGSDLRAESVQYLGISFAEKDWNGDTLDDPETGLQRLEAFYKGRDNEPHVREIYQKLGDIYFDETEYQRAIDVYRALLAKWPLNPDAPKVQDRIVMAYDRMRQFDAALAEREKLARNYTKGTKWSSANSDNPDAQATANSLAEAALLKYAVEHHNAAQALRKLATATNPPDGKKLEQAFKEYSLAADGYQRYLAQFGNTKNGYEYTFYYAESLYYSARFADAAVQYEKVRDSNLDNRFLEDASFNAVKSYENLIDGQQKQGKLVFPPLPVAGKVQTPVTPIEIPEDVKHLQGAYDAYAQRVPKSTRLATMAYKAAEIDFRYLHWDDARKRMEDILQKYCADAVSIQAGKAILTSYTVENNLDKIREWVAKLDASNCAANTAEGKQAAAERKTLGDDVRFKQAEAAFAAKDYEKASQMYIDIVNSDPKNTGGNNDKALYNAAVGYENVNRFFAATKVFERIVQEYPSSEFVDDALFRTAVNYQRFFEFDKAVVAYQRLATDTRFKSSQHRNDSLYNAAVLLENKQDYDNAAKLFQTYAADKNVKPQDASDADFRAGVIYLKNKDAAKTLKTFRDFIKKYPNDPKKTIEANYHIAEALQLQKDNNGYLQQLKKVAAMGSEVPAASDAAEFPAHAAFILAEQELPKLEKMSLSTNPKELQSSLKKFSAESERIALEYNKVLGYKRATWLLAAYFRIGYISELKSKALATLVNAPCPKDIERKYHQEGCDLYTQQIQQTIEPIVSSVDEDVVKKYSTTLDQAAKLGVSNEWTKRARTEANAYQPDKFPMIKDELVDFQMESPQ